MPPSNDTNMMGAIQTTALLTCRAVSTDKSTLASVGDNLSAAVAISSFCSITEEGNDEEIVPSNIEGKWDINKCDPS